MDAKSDTRTQREAGSAVAEGGLLRGPYVVGMPAVSSL
jgi:hypothetical protein